MYYIGFVLTILFIIKAAVWAFKFFDTFASGDASDSFASLAVSAIWGLAAYFIYQSLNFWR
jgi:hypothetical protein